MKYTLYTLSDSHTITAQEIESPEHDGYLLGVHLEELSRRGNAYRRTLRGLARALWNGAMDFNTVFADFDDEVRIQLREAWLLGAAECGISPDELSPEERQEMRRVIERESSRVFAFLDWIVDRNRATGGKFGPIKSRVDMWALRWDDVFSRSKLLACSNLKYRWTLNVTRNVKTNCGSCLKLEGKIKRGSFWNRVDVHPQQPPNSKLDCGGWLCGCAAVETDEPLSRGPLPRLP